MHKNAKRKQCKPKTADSIGFQFKIRGKVQSNFDGNFNIINEDEISRRNLQINRDSVGNLKVKIAFLMANIKDCLPFLFIISFHTFSFLLYL